MWRNSSGNAVWISHCGMGGVVARFGDKLWDVAHIDSLHTYLGHIRDRDCYVFLDPKLKRNLFGQTARCLKRIYPMNDSNEITSVLKRRAMLPAKCSLVHRWDGSCVSGW